MRKLALYAAMLAAACVTMLNTTPAQAQASRTWVSGVGDDVNPCSRTAPCKTFAGAISKTAANGEINCLDSAGFGGVTITKSMTIRCVGTVGSVLVSGTNGITVNNTSGTPIIVVLDGLEMEGLGAGLQGVSVVGTTSSKVTISNSQIRHFLNNGVNIAGPAGTRVLITDSLIINNGANGVLVGTAGVANVGIVLRTVIDNNPTASITVSSSSTLFLGASKLLGAAASVANNGTFVSFGDNTLQGTGTPTSTTPPR